MNRSAQTKYYNNICEKSQYQWYFTFPIIEKPIVKVVKEWKAFLHWLKVKSSRTVFNFKPKGESKMKITEYIIYL